MFKKIILIASVVFVAVQFIQPSRNISNKVLATDITRVYHVPDIVQSLLKTACYDCHSNNTIYPWYSRIQPGAWFMANHVKNGKEDLNFSDFGSYSLRKQQHKLKSIAEEINEGDMPIAPYKLLHSNARLNEHQKAILVDWATKTKDSLTAKN
jgi:hypothetical protein